MEITTQIIKMTLVLIVVGLLITNWQPPIKSQYRCIILLFLGGILGHYLNCGVLWGVIISGLVFYKDELVKEVREVKECFEQIKESDEVG